MFQVLNSGFFLSSSKITCCSLKVAKTRILLSLDENININVELFYCNL